MQIGCGPPCRSAGTRVLPPPALGDHPPPLTSPSQWIRVRGPHFWCHSMGHPHIRPKHAPFVFPVFLLFRTPQRLHFPTSIPWPFLQKGPTSLLVPSTGEGQRHRPGPRRRHPTRQCGRGQGEQPQGPSLCPSSVGPSPRPGLRCPGSKLMPWWGTGAHDPCPLGPFQGSGLFCQPHGSLPARFWGVPPWSTVPLWGLVRLKFAFN